MVAAYAERLHAAAGERHHVASPLAAWLVLALAAPVATGETRAALEEVLGADADEASAAAADLLARPHPAVVSAAACWWAVEGGPRLRAWRDALPPQLATGPIPSRADVDAWVREHSLGLIETFPVDPSDGLLLLASVLATKVTWLEPFDVAPASRLGGQWAAEQVLTIEARHAHRAGLHRTARAGDVAVHTALADGLSVTAVVAAEGVPAVDVLAVAHEVALGRSTALRLADLPLGAGHAWTLTEEPTEHADGAERYATLLPAWHATARHELLPRGLGFDLAAAALWDALGSGGPAAAVQQTVASYDRYGFEAAAATGLALRVSAPMPRRGTLRRAELRFARPFAVVAVAQRDTMPSPWDGLPVFSAWVTEAVEPAPDRPEPVDDLY
ncbi:MAG: hypothetical protein ACTHOD_19775 [Motilibacteraceae bacterium]